MLKICQYHIPLLFLIFCSNAFSEQEIFNLIDNNEPFYVIGEAEKIKVEIKDLLPSKQKKSNLSESPILKIEKSNSNPVSNIKKINEIKEPKAATQTITKISGELDTPPKPENLIILNNEFNLANDNEISELKKIVFSNSLNSKNIDINNTTSEPASSQKKLITLEDLKKEREELEKMKLKLIEMQKVNFIKKDFQSSKVLSSKDFTKSNF